jgi:hypothetical protein
MYIRFIIGEIHRVSTHETGVFQAAYRLEEKGHLPDYEESRLRDLLEWFNTNLKEPDRFTSSKPPYYRKENKAISWFKDAATEHIAKLREILAILDNHDIHFEMIKTDRPGYIVYEDDHQVVAEPFSDSEA